MGGEIQVPRYQVFSLSHGSTRVPPGERLRTLNLSPNSQLVFLRLRKRLAVGQEKSRLVTVHAHNRVEIEIESGLLAMEGRRGWKDVRLCYATKAHKGKETPG